MKYPQIMPEEIAKIYWAKLLKVSRSIRQKHLIFDKSEKKGRIYQPYEKRCWQRDKSLYLHILEWTAESMEIHRRLENINRKDPINLIDQPFLEMIKETYCIEGGDHLIPLLVSSGFMSRCPKTAEKLLEGMKNMFSQVYPHFLSKAMQQELSEKGIPSWSGNIQRHLTGEM